MWTVDISLLLGSTSPGREVAVTWQHFAWEGSGCNTQPVFTQLVCRPFPVGADLSRLAKNLFVQHRGRFAPRWLSLNLLEFAILRWTFLERFHLFYCYTASFVEFFIALFYCYTASFVEFSSRFRSLHFLFPTHSLNFHCALRCVHLVAPLVFTTEAELCPTHSSNFHCARPLVEFALVRCIFLAQS